MRFVFVYTLCLIHAISAVDGNKEHPVPIVNIPALGQVRGSFLTSVNGRQFSAFRGIPYAKPPIGNLRFQDPVAAESWQGRILDATKEGAKCVQYDGFLNRPVGDEDCLHLNVYTHNSNLDERFLKPVMVWIHGGGFMEGSGNGENDFYGPGYMMDRDVVFVTINYRLAALGFFSTGDAEAPGNYGLLDQSLALRWVREHIRNFGGDPSSVTIFGESAGGASVEYQILSPYSKGLFDRAIAQSGSALCPWAFQEAKVEHYSRALAEDLKCPLSPSHKMVECLRGKDAIEIANIVQRKGLVMGAYPIAMFGPRMDKERENPFLPAEPRTLIKEKRFNSVPIIMGLMQNEASFLVAGLMGSGGKHLKQLKQDPKKFMPYLLGMEVMKNGQTIAEEISKHYFGDQPDYENQLTQFEQMISDHLFNKPVDDSAQLFSRYSDHPVYYYYYTHKGQFSIDSFMNPPPDFDQGISHASELFIMFTSKGFIPLISTPGDIKVSKLIIDLWTSFAADGAPKSHLVTTDWVPVSTKTDSNYLRIEAANPEMVINHSIPFHQRLSFWDRLYDESNVRDEL